MVAGDHFAGGHHGGRHVGDVTLQADQRLRAGQACLVENAVPGVGLDEPGGLGGAFPVNHGASAGLLGVECLLVTPCPFGRVRPDRPPRISMVIGIPHRFPPMSGVVDLAVGVSRGDGVDDLPVGENVTVPMEMGREIDRGLHAA